MNCITIEHNGKLLWFNISDAFIIKDLSDGFGDLYKKSAVEMGAIPKEYNLKSNLDFENNKCKIIEQSVLKQTEKDYLHLLIKKDYYLELLYKAVIELNNKQAKIIEELEKEHIGNILL